MEQEYLNSLVNKKDELRKKLFETIEYCRLKEKLEVLEIIFFNNASRIIEDEEFNKLIKKFEKVIDLISSINNLKNYK